MFPWSGRTAPSTQARDRVTGPRTPAARLPRGRGRQRAVSRCGPASARSAIRSGPTPRPNSEPGLRWGARSPVGLGSPPTAPPTRLAKAADRRTRQPRRPHWRGLRPTTVRGRGAAALGTSQCAETRSFGSVTPARRPAAWARSRAPRTRAQSVEPAIAAPTRAPSARPRWKLTPFRRRPNRSIIAPAAPDLKRSTLAPPRLLRPRRASAGSTR